MKPRVLLVEDDPARAELLSRVLRQDFDCTVTASADDALHALAQGGWDAAVVDFSLGQNGSGFLVLEAVRLISERTARVLYSSNWSDGLAQEAQRTARAHASLDARREDFVLELRSTLKRLLDTEREAASPPRGEAVGEATDRWCASATSSRRLLEELKAAAAGDGPVFVYGEPGVGKHLAAKTLQRWRKKRGAPAAGTDPSPTRVLRVPPLRERREDLPELAAMLLADLAKESGSTVRQVAPEVLAELGRRDWWGNVRELHAKLLAAVRNAGTRTVLSLADLPRGIEPATPTPQLAKDEGSLRTLLLQSRLAGSVSGAAKLAGVTTQNLRRLMKRLGVLRADTRKYLD